MFYNFFIYLLFGKTFLIFKNLESSFRNITTEFYYVAARVCSVGNVLKEVNQLSYLALQNILWDELVFLLLKVTMVKINLLKRYRPKLKKLGIDQFLANFFITA